jgi:lipid A ethanolaminephosphotransferase
MMGSHWWYDTRYPDKFKIFNPTIKSKHVPANSSQEMINSYDNTLVYLDYFIDETIKIIEKSNSNTILIYLSDHGEMLGENGLWLHAQNNKTLENPAMLIWYSNDFEKNYPEKVKNFKKNASNKTNLDFFFNTILDLYQIEGVEYDKNKSILRN